MEKSSDRMEHPKRCTVWTFSSRNEHSRIQVFIPAHCSKPQGWLCGIHIFRRRAHVTTHYFPSHLKFLIVAEGYVMSSWRWFRKSFPFRYFNHMEWMETMDTLKDGSKMRGYQWMAVWLRPGKQAGNNTISLELCVKKEILHNRVKTMCSVRNSTWKHHIFAILCGQIFKNCCLNFIDTFDITFDIAKNSYINEIQGLENITFRVWTILIKMNK